MYVIDQQRELEEVQVNKQVYELEKQLQLCHEEIEAALQHNKSLMVENEKLRQEVENLQRQQHHGHSDDTLSVMETTGMTQNV